MKTVCLRASLGASLLFAVAASAPAFAQSASDIPPATSLASSVSPLAGGRALDTPAQPDASFPAADGQRRRDPAQPGGPMTVVPVRNAFVIAPAVRFGKVNHRSATFAGATAGLLMDHRLFLGGGGYWLTNNSRGFEMGYAGAVAGWYFKGDGPIDLSLTGLVGGGWSTMTWVGSVVPLGMDRHIHQVYPQPGDQLVRAWLVGNDFFIAEPEATVCIRLNRSVWLNAGVAYRFISGAYSLDNDLRGVTGTVAITFGLR